MAHNSAFNSSTDYFPYEIAFGIKSQVPHSLKLGLYCDQIKKRKSDFRAGRESRAHTEHKSNNETLDRFLKNQISAKTIKRKMILSYFVEAPLPNAATSIKRSTRTETNLSYPGL